MIHSLVSILVFAVQPPTNVQTMMSRRRMAKKASVCSREAGAESIKSILDLAPCVLFHVLPDPV